MAGSGSRRNRVTIEQDVSTSSDRDAGGQRVPVWSVYAQRWARKVPRSSREFVRLSQQRSEITYVLVVRKDNRTEAVTTKMRVTEGNQVLEIVGVDPDVDGKRREVALQCIEAT